MLVLSLLYWFSGSHGKFSICSWKQTRFVLLLLLLLLLRGFGVHILVGLRCISIKKYL